MRLKYGVKKTVRPSVVKTGCATLGSVMDNKSRKASYPEKSKFEFGFTGIIEASSKEEAIELIKPIVHEAYHIVTANTSSHDDVEKLKLFCETEEYFKKMENE